MSKRVYTTANGKQINIDALIAQNENTIAVGNMKVNARGDQLGAGGKVEASRDKVMNDYYKLNTPVAVDQPLQPREQKKKDLVDDWIEPVQTQEETPEEQGSDASTPPVEQKPKLRGSLADTIAKNKPQEKEQPKKTGPSRI
jgi:hypothetical protein